MRRSLFSIGLLAGLLSATSQAVAAGWPTSVIGTWGVRVNRDIGLLTIETQAATPTNGCRAITGTIQIGIVVDPIAGYYCPPGGRLSFKRYRDSLQGDVIQVYTAQLSQALSTPDRMSGTVDNYLAPRGAFSFEGTLPGS